MNKAKKLKRTLFKLIVDLEQNHREFLVNPNSDFTRFRKLDFDTVIKMILLMGAGSLKDELYSWFGLRCDNPSSSALIQQRSKICPDAFKWLFDEFNKKTAIKKTYKNMVLLAVDGSEILISHDPKDKKTYIPKLNKDKIPCKGYNSYHLNAAFDILEHTYFDVELQGQREVNERDYLTRLVDRCFEDDILFIADRGYESYNVFAHCIENNKKFLIRCKDINSNYSLSQGLRLNMEGEFDIDVRRILTTKQTNEVKLHPELYRFLSTTSRFDYVDKENPFYEINLRVVRFKISEDSYELIITNLDREEFPMEEIKKLYNMRWGIETSFRELKYTAAMVSFHGKKREFIEQEIYTSLLFYNYCERVIQNVVPKKVKSKKGYTYKINSTRAFHNLRSYLRIEKGGKEPPDIEAIISKEIEPVRPGRSDPRKIRKQQAQYFVYRLI